MKTCLICGNGPSLADIPNDTLDKFDTFGGNRIYLKYEPTYYVFVDSLENRDNDDFIQEINNLKSEKYITLEFAEQVPGSHILRCVHDAGFTLTPMDRVFAYFSVVTVMIQLAVWKGYNRIGMVGLDHRYHEPRGERQWHLASEDCNHFTPDYYDGYSKAWKAPHLELLDFWFKETRKLIEQAGGQIVNLTPNSGSKAFPTGNLADWVKGLE